MVNEPMLSECKLLRFNVYPWKKEEPPLVPLLHPQNSKMGSKWVNVPTLVCLSVTKPHSSGNLWQELNIFIWGRGVSEYNPGDLQEEKKKNEGKKSKL